MKEEVRPGVLGVDKGEPGWLGFHGSLGGRQVNHAQAAGLPGEEGDGSARVKVSGERRLLLGAP